MLRGKADFKTDNEDLRLPSFGGADLPQGLTVNISNAEDGSGTDDGRGSDN